MNYRSKRHKGAWNTFQAEINKDKLIIRSYISNKKLNEERYSIAFIEEYLNQGTLYQRRKYIQEKDVNKLKTEKLMKDSYTIEANLDAINEALIEVLKLAGLYREVFQERVRRGENEI